MEDNEYRRDLEGKLKQDPKNISLLVQLGALLFERFHDHNGAIELLRKAIKYAPENIDAKFWLAMCFYHDFCEYDKAAEILDEALKLDPNRSDCLSLRAYVSHEKEESLETSLSYLQRAIQHAPDWPMLRLELVSSLVAIGKIDDAEKELKKALKLKPFKEINNEVERYYENVVTGRSWSNLEEKFSRVISKIQQMKINKNV